MLKVGDMRYILNAGPLILALFGIYLTSLHSYLLFHCLAEVFSIVIACGIFIVIWNSRRLIQNHYLLFIGIGYFHVAVFDLLHTLAFKGMGVFEGYGANLPTQLWVAGRFLEAFSLLFATFFLYRNLPPYRTFAAFASVTALLLASIFYWNIFPDSYIEGFGLTYFKIYSEYAICLVLLAVVGLLIKNSEIFDRKVLVLVVFSILTAIVQELAFTTYLSVYGPSNMIGHLLKVVSFYLIYKAILETSLVTPCELLFRDLKQSEARFRSIFETNVVPIAYCTVDGRVIDANENYLRLIGFSKEELQTTEVRWDTVTPPEWKHVDETALRLLERDGVCNPVEKEYLRRDGTRVPIIFGACRIPGNTGQLVAFAIDLTDRKRVEDALRESEERLRKSRDELELRVQERTSELRTTIKRLELLNQELQEFAYVASHDLQEPLRKIQTFCDLAIKRCSSEIDSTGHEYLKHVLGSAGRMRQLLHDLLEFSRVASKPHLFKQIDLRQLAQEAADIFEATIKETDARIEIGTMPVIEADEIQMLRLFQNLIGNSLKYRSNAPPIIKVHAEEQTEGICDITLTDNGIGFDRQYSERIFAPFQRLHGRNEYDGTGMGLAICRKIAERHGGSIRADSEAGAGSRFTIRLPVKHHPSAEQHGERLPGTETDHLKKATDVASCSSP